MILPKKLTAAVVAVGALAAPTVAQAAAPWSAPIELPGSSGQAAGAPNVLFTRAHGGVVTYNGAGSFPGAPMLRNVLTDSGPLPATRWDGAVNFDTTWGALAAGDQLLYVGSNGERRVNVALAASPEAAWKVSVRGPSTGGARVAAAPGAAAFSTFGRGDMGYVYLVRQTGATTLGPTQRLSKRGHIRSVAVARNAAGDVLVAWDRSGHLESRMWIARSKRLTDVQQLGTTVAAMHLTVALGSDRRAIVAWVDQRVSEGNTNMPARVMAAARSGSRGFLPAKQLEVYPDTLVPGGRLIEAAYTSGGRGIIAWSGRSAVRAAFVDGRLVRAPQDLAPIAPDEMGHEYGFGDLAVSANGSAVVTMVAPADGDRSVVLAAPLVNGAFGPAETVSAPAAWLHEPSAAFQPGTNELYVAWQVPPQQPGGPNRVEMSQRPAP